MTRSSYQSFADLLPVPAHELSLQRLKEALSHLPESDNKTLLLDLPPQHCNYILTAEDTCCGMGKQYRILYVLPTMWTSEVVMRSHLQATGITPHCKVMLKPDQCLFLNQLFSARPRTRNAQRWSRDLS